MTPLAIKSRIPAPTDASASHDSAVDRLSIDQVRDIGGWLTSTLPACGAEFIVLLVPSGTGEFEVVASAGEAPVPAVGERVSGGEGSLCGYATVHSGTILFDDIGATERFRGAHMATECGAVSSMVVALRRKDTTTGVLSVHARRPRAFTDKAASRLEQAAESIAVRLTYA
jgi:GAF domain-containing protein